MFKTQEFSLYTTCSLATVLLTTVSSSLFFLLYCMQQIFKWNQRHVSIIPAHFHWGTWRRPPVQCVLSAEFLFPPMLTNTLLSVINAFRKIFNAFWRESVKPLLYYCACLPISYVLPTRRIIFWRKMYYSSNTVLNALAAYNISVSEVLHVDNCTVKSLVWEHFAHTINW